MMQYAPQPTSDIIQTILEKLPPAQWAAPFVGMIAAKPEVERHLFWESLRGLILAYGLANDPENVEQLGIMHCRLEKLQFPNVGDAVTGSVYVPAACYSNQVQLCPSEQEMREILGLHNRSDNLVNRLIAAIVDYSAASNSASGDKRTHTTEPFTFECAVHPYVDCFMVPAILYAVKHLLPDHLTMAFRPVPWGDLPRILDETVVHCSYGSHSLLKNRANKFHFRQIKEESTALVALCHSKDAQHNRYRAFNFPGYYSLKHDDREAGLVRIQHGNGEIDVQAETMASTGDMEILLLCALAFGFLPNESMIIPSTHGLIWAGEAGLLQTSHDHHCIGTLHRSRLKQQPADAFGFLIRAELRGDGRLWIAAGRLANILQEVKRACENRLLQQMQKFEDAASEALGVLRVPYIEAFEGDIGFTGRLRPKILLEMALPGAQLFEREADWQPQWWKQLPDDPTGNGSPQTQQPIVQDTH